MAIDGELREGMFMHVWLHAVWPKAMPSRRWM
jgi:hypothetical protein